MMAAGFAIAASFLVAGGLIVREYYRARQREADREARTLPPFVSTHWKDRAQREEWRRLTREQQQRITNRMQATVHRLTDWGMSYGG